jgi:hypothetical protein
MEEEDILERGRKGGRRKRNKDILWKERRKRFQLQH